MAPIVAACFNVLVSLVLPVGMVVWLAIRRRKLLLPYAFGALTFFISQILLRLPLLQLVNSSLWFQTASIVSPVIVSLTVGLSAGVFEEVGRYTTMRLMKKRRTLTDAVIFGLGHGGIEAVLLVGINNLGLLVAYPDQLLSIAPGMVVLAGIERVFAVMLHVGLSVMVMQAVEQRKLLLILLAIVIHGIIDGLLGVLQLSGWSIYAIELYVALCSLGLLAYTIFTIRRKKFDEQ